MKKTHFNDVQSVDSAYLVVLTHSHHGLLTLHLGHLKPPRTFLTRHLFIDGHLLPSEYCCYNNNNIITKLSLGNEQPQFPVKAWPPRLGNMHCYLMTSQQWQNVVSTISHMCDIVDTMFCHCGSVTLCYTAYISGGMSPYRAPSM